MDAETPGRVTVELLWIPLGAGQRVVRCSGWMFEALVAAVQRRPRCRLYHSALLVHLPGDRVVIEMAPEESGPGAERGAVRSGAVGLRPLGRWRVFRYEVRCWHGGTIPDEPFAVDRRQLDLDAAAAAALVGDVASVPAPVWGRDELHVGEMWNSNSVVSWLLARAGVDVRSIALPAGGRAPGWDAGIAVASLGLAHG